MLHAIATCIMQNRLCKLYLRLFTNSCFSRGLCYKNVYDHNCCHIEKAGVFANAIHFHPNLIFADLLARLGADH
jgi:hypothetical protein